jgi:hypothetical protein
MSDQGGHSARTIGRSIAARGSTTFSDTSALSGMPTALLSLAVTTWASCSAGWTNVH